MQARGRRLVYDVAHNIAKEEEHEVETRTQRLLFHRKDATRAVPPDHPRLREAAGQALPVVARLWPLGGVKG